MPLERFELLSGRDELTTDEFNSRVAEHHFCRHCGVHSFYVPRSDPDEIDVNVRYLDGVTLDRLPVSRFDGRHWETAIGDRPPWR